MPAANPLLRRLNPELPAGHPRLICFPHAGGGASAFRLWPEALPGIEVFAVQLPGREDRIREPLMDDPRAIVEELAAVVGQKDVFDHPLALFGHSMGALLTFELARELRARFAVKPTHLFVSGRGAPHLPASTLLPHRLPDLEFAHTLRREYGGFPDAILREPELLALFLRVLRADFTVLEKYEHRWREALTSPISAFGGLSDTSVDAEALAAWSEHTTGGFSLTMLPGGHFFVDTARAPLVSAIAATLGDRETT